MNEIKGKSSIEGTYQDANRTIPKKRLGEYSKEIEEVFKKQEQLRELEEYSSEISSVLADYNRKSCEETMMVKGFRKSNQETTNRKTHSENLENIALRIAKGINRKEHQTKGIGLNYEITGIMARNHDVGHTFLGHSGEWWLSNIGEDYGIGYYVHNAVGPRELIYTNDIYQQIMETIKQSHPNLSAKRLERIRSSLWLIMDGINSHNGEKSESEYRANVLKTEKDFEQENLECFTKKGYDKHIIPATPEAALMRLCDKISYIPYDMVDGLREGFITGLNEEYIAVLNGLGIATEEIEACKVKGDYEKIARKIQTILINDVIENSTGTVIKMSDEKSKFMHQLRNINNRQIVDYVVLQEDNDTYPPALRKLMNAFGRIAIRENMLEQLSENDTDGKRREELLEKYEGTPFKGFIEYICKASPEDFAYTQKIVEEATRQGIADEQEKARQIVERGEEFQISPDFKQRDMRIQSYIRYYQAKNIRETGYTEEQKEEDIVQIMENIKNPKKRSCLHFSPRKRVALELGRKYLANLNDVELMQLLLDTGIVNETQLKSLTRKYKDIDLKKEVYIQENWKKISQEQKMAVSTDQEEK